MSSACISGSDTVQLRKYFHNCGLSVLNVILLQVHKQTTLLNLSVEKLVWVLDECSWALVGIFLNPVGFIRCLSMGFQTVV